MDMWIESGLRWVMAVQAWGAWLEAPMKFFSFLGTEEFFFLVGPLLYWCVDAALGMRVAFMLLSSTAVNGYLKFLFAAPRPYWVSDQVRPFSAESTFGIPSNHAQNAVSVWGTLAASVGRRAVWGLAILLMLSIGLSRLYLGVHFPQDVLAGWALGAFMLWTVTRYERPAADWFKRQTLSRQVLSAFSISLILIGGGLLCTLPLAGYSFPKDWQTNALRSGEVPDPVSMENFITLSGTLFGIMTGIAWLWKRGGYQIEGSETQKALRYVIGLIGVVLFMFGLDKVFPDGQTLIPFIFRYIRYALVGFWIFAGAPWLFFRFKLANSKM